MGGITAQEQVAKKPYKNQTAGWQGVTKLDHLGAQVGAPVEPYGVVYLSDEEAILTARAPRLAKDNPFVEQPFDFLNNDTGQVEQHMMAPLVLITDDREVPAEQERYVPVSTDEGLAAAQRETEAALSEGTERAVPASASKPVLVPSSTAAVPPSHATRMGPIDTSVAQPPEDDLSGEDPRASWTDNPERTTEVQQGALGGSNEAAGAPDDADPATTGSPTAETHQKPAPQPPVQRAQSSVEEEHAAHKESGEETGAADTPVGDAPEGEYASHEEVGSPDAPTQGES